eukprot:7297698-Karenia_brevis.AAC.1
MSWFCAKTVPSWAMTSSSDDMLCVGVDKANQSPNVASAVDELSAPRLCYHGKHLWMQSVLGYSLFSKLLKAEIPTACAR